MSHSIYLNNNHASTMGASGAALSGATSGANTTTGYELVIPLSAIGYTGGNIMVLADINGGGDGYLPTNSCRVWQSERVMWVVVDPIPDQVAATFNFANTPGEYFTVGSRTVQHGDARFCRFDDAAGDSPPEVIQLCFSSSPAPAGLFYFSHVNQPALPVICRSVQSAAGVPD